MTRLTVVGQGKLGFPVAAYYAERGATVVGLDVDEDRVAALNDGVAPVDEPGASEALPSLVGGGAYQATTDPESAYSEAGVVIVLAPLLANGGVIDFGSLDSAVGEMAGRLPPDAIVIFETTLPVGATRGRFGSFLKAGGAAHVAYSPERVSSGRMWKDLDTYPKLVGGLDRASTEAAAVFYEAFLPVEVRVLGSCEAAEMTKLAETTYRDLNIAFANDLARFADEWGVDVAEVIDAANSQPHSHIHRPGVGVGGHCIPHYPHMLEASTSGSDLVAAGRRANERMPRWVVERVAEEAGPLKGKSVHLLGAAYRSGVKESSSSPVFDLSRLLSQKGADVTASDPMYTPDEIAGLGLAPGVWETAEIVILVTDHLEYRAINWDSESLRLFVDGRNALQPEEFVDNGVEYLGIGRQGAAGEAIPSRERGAAGRGTV